MTLDEFLRAAITGPGGAESATTYVFDDWENAYSFMEEEDKSSIWGLCFMMQGCCAAEDYIKEEWLKRSVRHILATDKDKFVVVLEEVEE